MINKKKLGAFVLAGTRLLSMGTTVFAAGEPTVPDVNQNGTVPITKEFEMADGLKTPAATFKFTAPMSEQTTFTGNIGSEPVECTAETAKAFTLADREKLIFNNLPVGTTYVVKELAAKDGYTPSVTVIENKTTTLTNKTVQEAEALDTLKQDGTKNLVGEYENKVTFTNTHQGGVVPTGILMNNLPFILLVAVAIVAFVSLAVIKRRRTSGK